MDSPKLYVCQISDRFDHLSLPLSAPKLVEHTHTHTHTHTHKHTHIHSHVLAPKLKMSAYSYSCLLLIRIEDMNTNKQTIFASEFFQDKGTVLNFRLH